MPELCQNDTENQDIMPELVPDLNNGRLMPDHSTQCQIWRRKCQYGNTGPPNLPQLQPYSIQVEFMRQLFVCIQNGKIGIFESPTGTGKSLSLICGSLAWLQNFQRNFLEEAERAIRLAENLRIEYEKSKSWLDTYEPMKVQDELAFRYRKQLESLKAVEERLRNVRFKNENLKTFKPNLKKKAIDEDIEHQTEAGTSSNDEDMVLDDYFSDDELDEDRSVEKKNEENDQFYATKIFYASRTHSQIGQFLNELKRTKYATSTRAIILGSRQNMCINDDVRKLGNINLMNDKCLQLQNDKCGVKVSKSVDENNGGKRKKMKKCGSCPYFRSEASKRLADEYLSRVQDIEEMVDTAKKAKCCPYYASRYAVADADVVMAPYQIILSPSARAACNIKLPGSVVIIDEAHNLLDTINAVNSCKIDFKCVKSALTQLSSYLERYKSRLNPSNLLYLRHLTSVLNALSRFFDRSKTNSDKQIYN
uniref:Helicase ATP-binding domain-containing protein n=1 Tax=Romanomermis culicivorax TaxID=13658 RepID=A0A915HKQ2_ROMCU